MARSISEPVTISDFIPLEQGARHACDFCISGRAGVLNLRTKAAMCMGCIEKFLKQGGPVGKDLREIEPTDENYFSVDVIPAIHVFLVSGKTFTFKNVSALVENETGLEITYVSMKDSTQKRAHFPWGHGAAGYSRIL